MKNVNAEIDTAVHGELFFGMNFYEVKRSSRNLDDLLI